MSDASLHRNLATSLSCVLYLKDIQYQPDADGNPGASEEIWSCELSSDDKETYGSHMVEIEGIDKEWIDSRRVISGTSSMTVSEATIHEGTMTVAESAVSTDSRWPDSL